MNIINFITKMSCNKKKKSIALALALLCNQQSHRKKETQKLWKITVHH